jgi:hypothetical protein
MRGVLWVCTANAEGVSPSGSESTSTHGNERAVGGCDFLSHRPLLEKLVELRGIKPLTLRLPERKKGEK